jgi:hypothetical protein
MRLRKSCLLIVTLIGLAGCSERTNPRVATRVNTDAEPGGEVSLSPLAGKVITSWVNKQDSTMSTLFGNEVAWQYARTNSDMQYPARAVLSVVTWSQQEDTRWFGGNIPQKVKSVEVVSVVTGSGRYLYQRYEGFPLKRVVQSADPNERADYLLSQRAAVMP